MIIMGKLTMVNIFVLDLSTRACYLHFIASWGCVLYLFMCFLLRCWLCKVLVFIVLTSFMLSDFLKVDPSNAACTRLICIFVKIIMRWKSDSCIENVPVLLLLWCATSFQRVRYLPLLVANQQCVLCLRTAISRLVLVSSLRDSKVSALA